MRRCGGFMGFSRIALGVFFCATSVLGAASSAEAGLFRLRVEDVASGIGVVLTDNGVGDLDLTEGSISFAGALGSLNVSTSVGLSHPEIGDPHQAALHLNGLVTTSGGGSIRLSIQDTGFTIGLGHGEAHANGVFSANLNMGTQLPGSPTSTIGAQSWVNPNNAVRSFGADQATPAVLGAIGALPLGSIAIFDPAVIFNPSGGFAEDYASFLVSGPYSLFSEVTIGFGGKGRASFDLDTSVPVPEPGTLILFGTGLLGIARIARRRIAATKA